MPDLTPDVERELAALDDALAGRRVAPDLADLGELALLLREERPAPDRDFGRDARRARGARVPRDRARARARPAARWCWPRWTCPALGIAAARAAGRR